MSNKRKSAVLALLVLTAGCGPDSDCWVNLTRPSEELLKICKARVVTVENDDYDLMLISQDDGTFAIDDEAIMSGVLIDSLHVLTAKHGIGDTSVSYRVRVNGVKYSVKKNGVKLFPDLDLAVLTLEKGVKSFGFVKPAERVNPQPVFWFGCSVVDLPDLTYYGLLGWIKFPVFNEQYRIIGWGAIIKLETENSIIDGSSGSPLFNFQGELLGIITGSMPKIGVAILANKFKDSQFLKEGH